MTVTTMHLLTMFTIAQDNDRDKVMSDQDALDLIQADGIVGAVIELGRARRLVVGNLLIVSAGQLPPVITARTLEDDECSASPNWELN